MRSRTRPSHRGARRVGALLLSVALAATLAACSVKGDGSPGVDVQAGNVPASALPIVGDGGTSFDQETRNALTDIQQFWALAYPSISGGEALKPLSGGVYSVETGKPNSENKCMAEQPTAADNNAFYCQLDDTFAYDRVGLVKVIADQLGENFVPLVFAHEFGHLIQERTDLFDRSSILLESQADCASGAFMAAEAGVSSIKLTNKHFNVDPKGLDKILLGMILLRDRSPHDVSKTGSHGNGFDRLSAFSDGFNGGVTKCYSSDWTSRQFTERDYSTTQDQQNGGNLPFDQIASTTSGLIPDLNRFWTGAFKSINKTFNPVKVKAGAAPCAGDTGTKFAYCPSDNTVYYDSDTAKAVYYSVPVIALDQSNKVTIEQNSAGDYALGAVFAYAWGFAVRSQVGLSIDDTAAMLGAACYTGAYSENINIVPTKTSEFTLSPQDMDEASVAILRDVPLNQLFGARNTTGFQRIDSFKKGYFGTLTACAK